VIHLIGIGLFLAVCAGLAVRQLGRIDTRENLDV
jgi:hypothetical protein